MSRLTTQSYVKIALVIVLGLLVIGIFSFGSCSRFHWGDWRSGQFTETGNAEVDARTVRNIDIDWASGSVDIKVHDQGDKVIVTESSTGGFSRAQEMRWSVSGNTLKIDYGNAFTCMNFEEKHLEVSVPRSLAENMGELDIDGASGSYNVKGITCAKFRVDIASGSVRAEDMHIGDVKIGAASGNSSIEGVVTGELKADVASGEIEVKCNEVAPDVIDADMASGTVKVWIPEDAGFTAKIDKLSGDFESDFATKREGDSYVYGNGATRIKADMASGRFILKQTP